MQIFWISWEFKEFTRGLGGCIDSAQSVHVLISEVSIIERLSMTFTANGKNRTFSGADFSRWYNLGKLFAFTVIKGFVPIFRLALFKC